MLRWHRYPVQCISWRMLRMYLCYVPRHDSLDLRVPRPGPGAHIVGHGHYATHGQLPTGDVPEA